ncbi:LysR family transcriptional regulator [Lentilitoribacter sp. EG35]|uniref:LysR family transcriptional regulator n=1 Tax=Lentilitoribacter sp. EG35 TaxID=3234192 RepID=UPI003460B67C
MRLEWIEDILAVLDHGSLAHAAEKRFLTQSAFTRRIRLIENSVGAVLFDRTRKPVTLMPGVAALEPELRDLCSRLQRLQNTMREVSNPHGHTVTIACQHALTTLLSSKLAGVLRPQKRKVRVRSGDGDECLMLLLSGEVEFAMMYDTLGIRKAVVPKAFESISLGVDTLIPVCAPSMRSAAEQNEVPVISYPSDVFLGKVFERAIVPQLPSGVTVSPKAETSLTLAMLQFAIDGYGVAWLPKSLVFDHIDEQRLISLSSVLPEQELGIKMFSLTDARNEQHNSVWLDLSEISHHN